MQDRDLFAGFNCTDLEAQMIPHTHTASVCQPSTSDEVSLTGTGVTGVISVTVVCDQLTLLSSERLARYKLLS